MGSNYVNLEHQLPAAFYEFCDNNDNHIKVAKMSSKKLNLASPPSNDGEETATVFCLLPEIWDHIFQYLTHSDFLSVINSCPKMREMFKDKKAKKLYPLVVPILLNHDIVLHHCFLNWRMINKETKFIADTMLEGPFSPDKYWENLTNLKYGWSPQIEDEKEMLRQKIWKMNSRCYSLDNQAQVDNLLAHFGSFDGNPFPTGYLQVKIPEQGPWHHENFEEFIIKHGHHISHLSWHFQRVPNFYPIILQPFFRLLHFLPNLKVLRVACNVVMSQELPAEFLRQESYPKLKHLEFLDIESFVDPYTAFWTDYNAGFTFKFLQHYGSQLKTLVANNDIFKSPAILRLLKSGHLHNLRRLRLHIERRHSLKQVGELELPYLEELQIYEDRFDEDSYTPKLEDDVFKVINKFSQSLVRLQLFVSLSYLTPCLGNVEALTCEEEGIQIPQNSEEGSITPLPKLISFSTLLENRHSTWFWPFITLQCSNVETLSLSSYCETTDTEKDVAILQKAVQLGTNPKLKKINVTCAINSGTRPGRVEITADGMRTVKFKKCESL
ncbi:hypothetical protein Ocin01_09227 [Orchesella cincta]|uniref:F-box domain-containing protein n=1 Tax=Orchesella cincta TaxID=48709 RepID=A0A1D2MXC9_ORCCI|nr:hypothetical protein Ocin01_09227 [Orchesella cincta]